MTMRLFLFGAGYSGRAIARSVIAAGGAAAGTTRSAQKAKELQAQGIEAHLFDGGALSPAIVAALHETTHLVVSIAPGRAEGRRDADDMPSPIDKVLAVAQHVIVEQMPALRWIGYLSSVGVYGDHGGAWVDEEAQCRPISHHSQLRLAAEHEWLALSQATGVATAVLRLAGIYGPGRNGFVNLANGTARRIVKQDQVFNRIHVDDIAGASLHLAHGGTGGIFNGADGAPAPGQDVVAFAAALMGVEPPPEIAFEDAQMTAMARSFYAENKRISNARLVAAGYRFRFPDYRAALTDLWRNDIWRGCEDNGA